MKTTNIKLIFTLILFSYSFNGFSQDKTETIKETVINEVETKAIQIADSKTVKLKDGAKIKITDEKTIEVTDSVPSKTDTTSNLKTIEGDVKKNIETPQSKVTDSTKVETLNKKGLKLSDSTSIKKAELPTTKIADSTTIKMTDSTLVNKLKTPSEFRKKIKFGMGFGLSFVGGTSIGIAPNLTYKLNDKINLGVGLQWNYLSIKDVRTSNTIGANTTFMYNLSKSVTSLLEFSQQNITTESDITNTKVNKWESALFAGAGFNITNKISIGAKYNFLYKEGESIYSSPVIPFVNMSF